MNAGVPRVDVTVFLRTLLVVSALVLALALLVLLAGPFLLLAGLTWDPRRRLARRLTRGTFAPLLRALCVLTGVPLKLDMSPDVDWPRLGPCIIVANHASAMDALALMQLPPGIGDGRIWAKAWPFKKPLLGSLMRLSGHLRVDDFNLLPDARDLLSSGETMLVFPEASRSRNGRLARFHDGAFLLAARTGRPIVPVAIRGTHACFPPGQPWIFPPHIQIDVLGVIHPADRAHADLKHAARQMIEAALEPARQPASPSRFPQPFPAGKTARYVDEPSMDHP
jgi:1-acyl-sn-glycerol-3-phosphate acyltransferase